MKLTPNFRKSYSYGPTRSTSQRIKNPKIQTRAKIGGTSNMMETYEKRTSLGDSLRSSDWFHSSPLGGVVSDIYARWQAAAQGRQHAQRLHYIPPLPQKGSLRSVLKRCGAKYIYSALKICLQHIIRLGPRGGKGKPPPGGRPWLYKLIPCPKT